MVLFFSPADSYNKEKDKDLVDDVGDSIRSPVLFQLHWLVPMCLNNLGTRPNIQSSVKASQNVFGTNSTRQGSLQSDVVVFFISMCVSLSLSCRSLTLLMLLFKCVTVYWTSTHFSIPLCLFCVFCCVQVLDARDPLGTRSKRIETYMTKEKQHKQLIFLLNKCDLVPTWVTVRTSFVVSFKDLEHAMISASYLVCFFRLVGFRSCLLSFRH